MRLHTTMRIVIGRREPVFAALLGRRLANQIVNVKFTGRRAPFPADPVERLVLRR